MNLIKVATLNIWGEQPPLAARMAVMAEQLAALAPDVLALQEVRVIPGVLENQAETLAARLGMQAYFAAAMPWGGGEEGLAILSRHPIVGRTIEELPHAHAGERRVILGATIQTPAGALGAFTTHLNYRLADGAKREDQIVALERFVAAQPSELPKILMGDFNAVPEADEIRYLRGLHSIGGKRVFYQDAFERRHGSEAGYTWARRNPFTERLRWLERDRRLDYIFVTPMTRDGRGVVHECRIVLDSPDASGCYPSDHFGLYAEIQISPLT